MGKVCLKCGHERAARELAPETECPKCGAVYSKVERALEREKNPDPVEPPAAPLEETPESSAETEPESAEVKIARLTAALETQTQLKKKQTRAFILAVTVIPSLFFGLGLMLACWQLFGPLIVIKWTKNIFGTETWTLVFSKNPYPWIIIAAGMASPFFVNWIRGYKDS